MKCQPKYKPTREPCYLTNDTVIVHVAKAYICIFNLSSCVRTKVKLIKGHLARGLYRHTLIAGYKVNNAIQSKNITTLNMKSDRSG